MKTFEQLSSVTLSSTQTDALPIRHLHALKWLGLVKPKRNEQQTSGHTVRPFAQLVVIDNS
ncbi:Uncharacterised protein [Mycobacterium tuberculosis]|nr:Uncharacterised protein [Mycobacterium tuberculosis]